MAASRGIGSQVRFSRRRPAFFLADAAPLLEVEGHAGVQALVVFEDGRDGIVAVFGGEPVADGGDEVADAVAEGQRQEQGDEQDGEGVGGRGYSVFPFK